MARLIVEAVSREIKSYDEAYQLELFVSVSRADDGVSVRGLKQENFRVCVYAGIFAEFEISPSPFSESPWEPMVNLHNKERGKNARCPDKAFNRQ